MIDLLEGHRECERGVAVAIELRRHHANRAQLKSGLNGSLTRGVDQAQPRRHDNRQPCLIELPKVLHRNQDGDSNCRADHRPDQSLT